jgi:transcriptional regulator with XRE-family HTH domain
MSLGKKTFGSFFKELRIRGKKTLRSFCSENGFDASNISKLERGIFPAPESSEKLEKYAKALGIKFGSEEWIEFLDLASCSRKTISLESIENLEVVNRLPILFRTLENKNLTGEDLDRLIELIKSNESLGEKG